MATVTRPHKSRPTPTAVPAAAPQPASQDNPLDSMRHFFGDRIAFILWVTCVLFMATLLMYDTIMGLFR